VTTPCVTRARERLEELGYEVLVFHATGAGGESLEALARGGFLAGVLDTTTTELADELVGGVFPAGPGRLEAAGAAGVPQVVSLGALDMVNFGPRDTVPPQSRGGTSTAQPDRDTHAHNARGVRPARPRDRSQAVRCARADGALRAAEGRLDDRCRGQPFYDADADAALFAALRETLADSVEVHEIDTDINDPEFAVAMADRLHASIQDGA